MTRCSQAVGVDIDGVLGDQVTEVLRRANLEHNLQLTYSDVEHWDLKIGDSSFVPLVNEAMRDPDFVLEMPVHSGAAEMLSALHARYTIRIVTVRPEEAMPHTKEWLRRNALKYDELIAATEAKKSAHSIDALVDDFPRNLSEYLENTTGAGVLVAQPWNQDLTDVERWLDTSRLTVVEKLDDVPAAIVRALG